MENRLYDYMDWPAIEGIVYSDQASPKDIMGPRLTSDGLLVQGFFPGVSAADVLVDEEVYPMEMQDEAGYYAALIPARAVLPYRYRVTSGEDVREFADPYAFPAQITEEEERAFCAGVYYHAYEKLGAHPMTVNGVSGTYFAVWAPNALRVSVVGDFNNWDGRTLPMHRMPMSGIFELFVPGVEAGASYKYELKVKGGSVFLKADPYAQASEIQKTGNSVVCDLSNFVWNDGEWMEERKKYAQRNQPISIYETKLTDWRDGKELADFAKNLGYTHVELLPVMEYLEEGTQGYATVSYYAPTSRVGSPADFQHIVDQLHQAGIGVILDWTPAHFPRYEGGLEKFDGTEIYESGDPMMGVHPMWNTLLYKYESPMVKDFLIANAFFWTEVYHVDGLRMDDVDAMLYLDYGRQPGQWRPNMYGTNENLQAIEFLKHLNSIMKKFYPEVLLIAQEDGLWPELTDSVENDHMGFDYKWSSGWTGDFLAYLGKDAAGRTDYHDQLTVSMLYAYCEHFILTLGKRDVGTVSNFMSKLPGSEEEKMAQVRAAYAYMMLHPGCMMTAPEADMPETLKAYIKDWNTFYKTHPALSEMDSDYDGFEWIQLMNAEQNILVFLRKTEKPEETLLAVCNFSAQSYDKFTVGVPFYGKYKEIFNSDLAVYGGRGVANLRAKTSAAKSYDERECSLTIKVPAYGVTVFSCTPAEMPAKKAPAAKKTAAEKASAKKTSAKKTTTEKTTAKKTTAAKAAAKKAPAAKTAAKKQR